MNNNTRIRLHLSKGLFENIAQEVLAEAKKGDMSGGAYTEVVKMPKEAKGPKASPEVKKTDKMKDEGVEEMETKVAEKEEPVKEGVGGLDDPNFIAGVTALLGVGSAILVPYIKALKAAKSPEDKKKIRQSLSNAISKKMGGNMEEKKEEKAESAEQMNEFFGFGNKDKFKKGDIVLYKDETTPRKVLNVTKGRDKKTIYIISSQEQNGQFFTSGTVNSSEENLKPASK